MTDLEAPIQIETMPVRMPGNFLALSASVVFHLGFVLALWFLTAGRPIPVPTLHSIDVQVISEVQYRSQIASVAVLASPVPSFDRTLGPSEFSSLVRDLPDAEAPPAAHTPSHQMVHATHLFSTSVLDEPASREVRATLPTLAPYERITQICNIEATEQIRRADKTSNPETVAASAFGETTLVGGVLTALGAAYRSHAKWYAMRFACTVRNDLAGVADFSFELGAPIPKDQWESHDLIAVDEDDE